MSDDVTIPRPIEWPSGSEWSRRRWRRPLSLLLLTLLSGYVVAFGTRQEHVLNVALGANAYSKVLAGPADDPQGVGYGLDTGGSFGYLGVGYTYRFNTPFGSSPFVTLE